jgi:hypothetical protein
MNRLLSLTFAFCVCVCLAHADSPDPRKKEIADLIEAITPPSNVDWRERVLAGLEGSPPEEIARQRERLEEDKKRIPKLRQQLQVGTSVFDYPGLLSRGIVSFSANRPPGDGNYTLWISARYVGREAANLPWEFKLDFSDNGIITKIYDVQWK